jgi:hypothetical protein
LNNLMWALVFVLLLGGGVLGFTKLHDSIHDAITLRDTKDGIPRNEMLLMNVKACKDQLMKDIENQIRLGCTACYISVNVLNPSVKPIYVVELVPQIDYYRRWLEGLGYKVNGGYSGNVFSLNIRW